MVEWHVTPDYIINNWTDELLILMAEKLGERKERENEAVRPPEKRFDSEEALVARAGNLIKVVKKHGD